MALKGLKPQRGRPGIPFLGSALIHGALFAFAWATSKYKPEPMIFESYAIELYSPPPSVLAEEFTAGSQQLVVEKPPEMPDPAPPEPEPTKPEAEVKTEQPRPTTPKPPAPQAQPNTAPLTDGPKQPSAGPDAVPGSAGGENLNVRMEGLKRDYPAYYNEIVIQITRCFNQLRGARTTTQRFETTLDFVINRDGSIPADQMRVYKASGNTSFDIMAQGAVECAGTKLGPLPADLPFDRLPIRFKFTPAGAGGH